MQDLIDTLRERGIQPTPQRLEVARHVLSATDHPTADQVFRAVRGACPTVSRATVYNTLNLLVEKGLLVSHTLSDGPAVFDPLVKRHHHLIDVDTGAIRDVPWDALAVEGLERFDGVEVLGYHVVIRGRSTGSGNQG